MPNLQLIKTLAEERKITLRKIAEVAGMTEQGLHKAINKEDIKFGSIDKIANYFKVDLSLFSDFPTEKQSETKVSTNKHNLGNIAGANLINVALPETGTQKIIKPDGSISIESLSPNKSKGDESGNNGKQDLLNTIDLQKQLIESLQGQIILLKRNVEKE